MAISENQKELINKLSSISLLDSKFDNLRCINLSDTSRRGVCSIVFQATNILEGSDVAIKFFDPDNLGNSYELSSFERETKLLSKLINKNRCLQLIQPLKDFEWQIQIKGTTNCITLNCGYFVTEWLDENVDEYFFNKNSIDARERLLLFKDIILGVEAIHRLDVVHRDIKIDNLKIKNDSSNRIIVTIDFGRAVRSDDKNILNSYLKPVGAPGFAPPEFFCGFTGVRHLGKKADIYALGSLLFNLFNEREFRFEREHTNFNTLVTALKHDLLPVSDFKSKFSIWKKKMIEFRYMTDLPTIDDTGSDIPLAVKSQINNIYNQMCCFDFNKRVSDLRYIRTQIDSMMRCIDNQLKQKKEYRRRKELRNMRKLKAKRKEQRLQMYLQKRLTCNDSL